MRSITRAMRPLDRKLVRDLWRLRGQVLAIAMVIASGVAVLVMSLGALQSLRQTAAAYYERARFAHVFAHLERAPEALARRLEAIPGVQMVEPRIARLAVLDVAGFEEPVTGQVLSIPEHGEPRLNRLTLRAGRSVAPDRPDEAVLSEAFAEAHGLAPGSRIGAIIDGHRRELQVVGIALSPEFVYAIGPGALMPDDRRFGVVWMGREALAAASDLEGAFNDVSISLLPGVDAQGVVARVDALLAPYGGIGAYARKDQISNWFLMNEIAQLANLAQILPTVFLAVAAFLTHMVLARLIAIERSEIGLLKAFGYSNTAVGWHFVKLVAVIGALGLAIGYGLGWWYGRAVTAMYAEFFRFPFFFFRPSPGVFGIAALVSLGAALAGTGQAVAQAVRLAPAEAMRPPSPPLYTRADLGRAIETLFDQPTRIVLRNIVRWPTRSFTTAFGVAMSVGLLVTSLQWNDAVEALVEVYFEQGQHQDASVGFTHARSAEALRALRRLPGVEAAEPMRFVSARLGSGPRSKREAIQGIAQGARLAPLHDAQMGVLPLPPDGLVLSTKLARKLQVGIGDLVHVEVLEGRRPVRDLPVSALFETWIGTPAVMDLRALDRLMLEPPSIGGAHLRVDAPALPAFFRALKATPAVSAVMLRRAAIDEFHDTMGETMLIFVGFFAAFSSMLAFGVTYNATRVALSERGRELATLRVLGMTRAEIAYILLGEVGLLAMLALPLGCLVGLGLAAVMAEAFETDLYRVPLVIEPSTYGFAMLVAAAATAFSVVFVRRRLDRLDLIAVLKTRE